MKGNNLPPKTEQLVDSLSNELDRKAKRCGEAGILPLNGYAEKIYGVKLSDALKNICSSMLDDASDNVESVRAVLFAGMLAWNLSVWNKFYPKRFREHYNLILIHAEENGYVDFGRDITLLMERKKKLYPQIDMLLNDCKVVVEEGEYRLAVAGTPCDNLDMIKLKKMFPEAFDRIEKQSLWQKIRGYLGWNAPRHEESGNGPHAPLPPEDIVTPEIIPSPAPELASPDDVFDFGEVENDEAMPSYREIFPSERELTLFIGSRELAVNDFYCLNSNCHCHESIVEFAAAEAGEEQDLVFGVYSIDYQTRDWNIADGYPSSPDNIPLPVLRSMTENQIPDFYQTLEERHKKLRQVFASRKAGTPPGNNRSAKKKKRKKNRR